MPNLPETILQFGSGKFLRAFTDFFVHEANAAGHNAGRVVVVQSTGSQRAAALERQHGRYQVLIRGLQSGRTIDEIHQCSSINRALSVGRDWQSVRNLARSPHLRFIVSNTAEEGYRLYTEDKPSDSPPRSFPSRLLQLLKDRYKAGRPGLTVLPCELFESNADLLLSLVLQIARDWKEPEAFLTWLQSSCFWRNTLVDRIVTNPPPGHQLANTDALLAVAEPFAFWGIEVKEGGSGGVFSHSAITITTDVRPYFLRKVRILNAAHTAMVSQAQPRGIKTVREAVLNPEIEQWLEQLLLGEILPTLEGRVEDPKGFARQTLERFRNPFLEHKISDIAIYHDAKVKIRLATTRDEYARKFGKGPPLLEEAIAWKQARDER